MQRQLLIPTSGNSTRLQGICRSISRQTVLPDQVTFLCHHDGEKNVLEDIERSMVHMLESINKTTKIEVYHRENSDYTPGGGVGADRQYLVNIATFDYCFMIDDDDEFGERFFEECLREYGKLVSPSPSPQPSPKRRGSQHEVLYSPKIMWRRSGKVQSAGIVGYRWWFPKMVYKTPSPLAPLPVPGTSSITPRSSLLGEGDRKDGGGEDIIMVGANSLLASRELFQAVGFDHRFCRMMEDIDFSYRAYLAGVDIVVSDEVEIWHMEREKTFLEQKFLGSRDMAKTRVLSTLGFVWKNGTIWQKIQFFGLGLWCMLGGFVVWGVVGKLTRR